VRFCVDGYRVFNPFSFFSRSDEMEILVADLERANEVGMLLPFTRSDVLRFTQLRRAPRFFLGDE
jgi:hypothetical protein